MRIRDLDWLIRLVEIGSFTEAATTLRTSQPTLSRSMARIEAELGTPLLIRTRDGVRPTPAGNLVVEAAREILTRHHRMTDELAALLDPDAGTIRLAFLDSIATSLVPSMLGDFHAQAPTTRVLLRQEPAREILADLDSGAVDLAVTSFEVGAEYGWHPLQEERLVVVLPAHHRLAHRRRLQLSDLQGEELVTTPAGYGHRALVDGLLRDAGVSLEISFESQDLATIEGLVAAGLGVGIVPGSLAGNAGTVGIAIGGKGARRTIGLAWRGDRPLTPPAERFRQFVVARRV